MVSMPICPVGHCEWEALLPEYIEAHLRGASSVSRHWALREHLRTCLSCAVEFVELWTLIRRQEAELMSVQPAAPAGRSPVWPGACFAQGGPFGEPG